MSGSPPPVTPASSGHVQSASRPSIHQHAEMRPLRGREGALGGRNVLGVGLHRQEELTRARCRVQSRSARTRRYPSLGPRAPLPSANTPGPNPPHHPYPSPSATPPCLLPNPTHLPPPRTAKIPPRPPPRGSRAAGSLSEHSGLGWASHRPELEGSLSRGPQQPPQPAPPQLSWRGDCPSSRRRSSRGRQSA